jgi:hypothetical protein
MRRKKAGTAWFSASKNAVLSSVAASQLQSLLDEYIICFISRSRSSPAAMEHMASSTAATYSLPANCRPASSSGASTQAQSLVAAAWRRPINAQSSGRFHQTASNLFAIRQAVKGIRRHHR